MTATARSATLLLLGLLLASSLCPLTGVAGPLPPQAQVGAGSANPLALPSAPGSANATFARLMLRTSPVNNTHNASVAVDGQGGTHIAFSAYTSVNGSRPAYYGYCASGCSDLAHWTIISLGDVTLFGDYVSLALNPAGLPRVTWYREPTLTGGGGQYQYVECNGNCTNRGNWSQPLSITNASGGSQPWDVHYFALDPQGRPRLFYTDTQSGHDGSFYRYCDAGCTAAGNWHELKVTTARWNGADLVFNAAGQPRLAFITTGADYKNWMTYVECNQSCTTVPANWQGTTFYQTGASRAYSLRIDSAGHPRMAVYTGYIDSQYAYNDMLSYWGCDSVCTAWQSWHGVYIGSAGQGKQVDLALDSGDRPHLAYLADDTANSVYGLGYALCSSGGCETENGTWDTQIIEAPEDLDVSDPVPPEPGCKGTWLDVGKYPDIAVNAQGVPRIGYTVGHYQGVTCAIHEDLRLVRFAVATGGTTPPGLKHKTYLPMLKR